MAGALPASLRARLDGQGALCIAALGDSLTHGWMVRRGYFPRACDALEARAPDLRIERLGAGVPGDTAFGGRGRLPALLAEEPEIVLVQFGLNDCFTGERVEVYQRNLERICGGVLDAGATPVLVTSCPLEDPGPMRLARPFYEAMRSAADRMELPLADTCAHWLATEARARAPRALWQPDGVHPTDAGHALMAQGLVQALIGAEESPR
jgi:acyl-CoA thioesterase-1